MFKLKYLLIFIILSSCAGPYTNKDNGSRIELSEDDTFEVVLDGDANSNYSWQLGESPSFVALQLPVVTKTINSKVESIFHFKAISQGEEKILLIYSDGEERKKSFELTVVVGTLGPILSE